MITRETMKEFILHDKSKINIEAVEYSLSKIEEGCKCVAANGNSIFSNFVGYLSIHDENQLDTIKRILELKGYTISIRRLDSSFLSTKLEVDFS
jgi:hypothetical protein